MNEFVMLRSVLDGVRGICPDCADLRFLEPVDEHQLEWCCLDCGAALVSWQRPTAPARSRTPSEVA